MGERADRALLGADARDLPSIAIPQEQAQYVYEVWPQYGSKTRFFCKGRFMIGPSIDLGYNLCAWSCILGPSLFYSLVCAPWLLERESLRIFPILTFVALGLCIFFFILTSCSDPGIIPRASIQELSEGLKEEIHEAIGYVPPPAADEVAPLTQEQVNAGFRLCRTCQIVRPPRASHCADCQNCVLQFDHHCPFVNNCVGKRNYPFFCAFLTSVTLLGISVVIGIAFWCREETDFKQATLRTVAYIFAVPIIMLVLITFIFCLCHVFLVIRGRTTREFLRRGRIPEQQLHERGTLFKQRGVSFVRPRDRLTERTPHYIIRKRRSTPPSMTDSDDVTRQDTNIEIP